MRVILEQALSSDYLVLYGKMISFANAQSADHNAFDHFNFLEELCESTF